MAFLQRTVQLQKNVFVHSETPRKPLRIQRGDFDKGQPGAELANLLRNKENVNFHINTFHFHHRLRRRIL
jgi:hypothetical protein